MKMTRRVNRGVVGTVAVSIAASVAAFALMAATPTVGPEHDHAKPPKIGEKAPTFKLMDLNGKEHDLKAYLDDGKTVVLEWFNPGCPIVQKHHKLNKTMKETYDQFKDDDVVWLAINSGAKGKQGYGKEVNAKAAKDWKIEYPILLDESGKVGRAYGAKTTPHMYIISSDGLLVYKGAIDNKRKDAGEENYVELALKQHLSGETVETASTRSYGCAVKYGG
jgi:peroxiredoxin